MAKKLNNEYLRDIARSVGGSVGKRMLDNDYLKMIADGISSLVSTAGGAIDASRIEGVIPSENLPSYVDDVLEYATQSAFPATGETGKIYVDLSTNRTYRWSGSAYVEISASLALGETSSTAYRGDRGKAAYDHISDTTKHITATERTTWNDKAGTDTATQSANGLMSSTDKVKLDGIDNNANAYVLPKATNSSLGGVIPDGSSITVDSDGTIHAPSGGYTLPTMSDGVKGGAKVGDGLAMDGDVLSTTNDMGLSGVSVGQLAQVKTVDTNGVPTSWEAVNIERRLTVTCVTTDTGTVTGQTVTVRETDASGTVVATATYDGSPVVFSLPVGFHYHVSVTDSLRMHGAPNTATGTIGETDASVTITYASLNSVLEKDTNTGRYTNASLSEWWSRQKDGKVYGISMPKSNAVICTKTRDNEGIADPVPSTLAVIGSDPYATGKLGPYLHYDVNGGADTDGTPYVTAIRGIDNDFALDGTNGNVWSMCPVAYEKWTSGEDAVEWAVSDTEFDGSVLQPGAKLPVSGTRPYMLYAKYGGGMYNGAYMSVSGIALRTRDVSHNTLITITSSASTGYSGKSIADDWYQKMCWYTKYSNKDKQTYMQGCTNYNLNCAVTVAESDVTRVIIAKTNAANLLVGSSVSLGTSDHNNSVFGHGRILSIEDYDASNSAVNIDTSTTFTTTTSLKLSTEPWRTGVTNGITFDGSPTSNSSGKEPYVMNGIEMMYGCYEIISGVIVSNDGTTGWTPHVVYDTQNDATSLTANFVSCGAAMPSTSSATWLYPLYPEEHGGLIYGTTTGGSTTTGLADGQYMSKSTDTGTREWLSLGNLNDTRNAGPSYVNANRVLSSAYWGVGGRPSPNGRSRG